MYKGGQAVPQPGQEITPTVSLVLEKSSSSSSSYGTVKAGRISPPGDTQRAEKERPARTCSARKIFKILTVYLTVLALGCAVFTSAMPYATFQMKIFGFDMELGVSLWTQNIAYCTASAPYLTTTQTNAFCENGRKNAGKLLHEWFHSGDCQWGQRFRLLVVGVGTSAASTSTAFWLSLINLCVASPNTKKAKVLRAAIPLLNLLGIGGMIFAAVYGSQTYHHACGPLNLSWAQEDLIFNQYGFSVKLHTYWVMGCLGTAGVLVPTLLASILANFCDHNFDEAHDLGEGGDRLLPNNGSSSDFPLTV